VPATPSRARVAGRSGGRARQRALEGEHAARQARIDAVLDHVRTVQQNTWATPPTEAGKLGDAAAAAQEQRPDRQGDDQQHSRDGAAYAEHGAAGADASQARRVVKMVSFADDAAISAGTADGPHTDAQDPSAPQPRQAADGDLPAAAPDASIPSTVPDLQATRSPGVDAAPPSLPDDNTVPQFEEGMLQITAALTDSMRATRRLVTHSNSANGMFAQSSASAPPPVISEAPACTAERPAPAFAKSTLAAAVSGSLAQQAPETGTRPGDGDNLGPAELAEARLAKLQRLRSRPKPPPSRKAAPAARPTSAVARALLHTSSSGASSDGEPPQATGAVPSDNNGVRHESRGSDAENAQQQVARMVEGAQASQPPEEGAPWEEYVDFLEREVLDKASIGASQPGRTSQTGSVGTSKAQNSTVERAMKELQVPPVDKFKKMRGKDAQEAMAAQLARIQAAAGAHPTLWIPCACSITAHHVQHLLHCWRSHLVSLLAKRAIPGAELQGRSGGGRRSARGARRRTCSRRRSSSRRSTTGSRCSGATAGGPGSGSSRQRRRSARLQSG
jgi:hypothetical protein